MVKGMKKAVSFVVAVSLLVGSGLASGVAPRVTVTPEVVVQETDVSEVSAAQEGKPETEQQEKGSSLFDGFRTSFARMYGLWNRQPITAEAAPAPTPAPTQSFRDEVVIFLDKDTWIRDTETRSMPSNTFDPVIRYYDENGANRDDMIVNVKISPVTHDNAIVVSPEELTAAPFTFQVVANAPGFVNVSLIVTLKNGREISFYMTLQYGGELEKENETGVTWEDLGSSNKEYPNDVNVIDRVLVLDPLQLPKNALGEQGYQLKFSGIENPEDYYSKNIIFSDTTNPPGVVEVNEQGYLKIVGAGYTEVNYTNYANVAEGDKRKYVLRVIVLPQAKYGDGEFERNATIYIKGRESFVLETNAIKANRLFWDVCTVKSDNGDGREIKPTGDALLSYTWEDSIIKFSDAKAGTYRVRAYSVSKDAFSNLERVEFVEFDIVVELDADPGTKFMNIGDIYDIEEDLNIPEGMFGKLFQVTLDPPGQAGSVSVEADTGIVTAKVQGTRTVKILYDYKRAGKEGIYTQEVADSIGQLEYVFSVIDYFLLDPSSVTMSAGTTYPISYHTSCSDGSYTVSFECSEEDKQYIDVDAFGKVTAKKETPRDKPATVIAYLEMQDGVKKRATCTVIVSGKMATDITLDPAKKEISIGENLVVKVVTRPANLRVDLVWQSSDPSVFAITESGSSSNAVTVTGLKAGTAVLTAVNKDNIVVAYSTITVRQAATSIVLSPTNPSGKTGQSVQLYAKVLPENATNKTVVWESLDTNIATVDQNGKVTLRRADSGPAYIMAYVLGPDGKTKEAEARCTVKIFQSVTGVELDETLVEMYVGESKRLTYTVSPSTASSPEVRWTSFDTSIVTVSNEGMLSAKRPGTTQVMIMSEEDSSNYVLCTVVVKQKATGVRMNVTELTMNAGEYYDMDITVTPATATDANLTWESLNTKVVTVSSTGRVTARGVGTAIILVKTEGGATSYCTVTVLEAVRSMSLDPSELTVDVGEAFTIAPVFTPSSASNTQVRWESSDTSVATVSAAGTVTGVERGTAVITCTSMDGGYKAFCLVTVEDPLMEIRIDPDNYRLGFGKTFTLHASVVKNGEVIGDAEVEWYSSDDSICSVDKGGKITGEDYGYATITAEALDGSGRRAECEVRVVHEVTSIKLNHSALTIIQGESAALTATVQPSNATYKTVLYSSDDETVAMVDDDGVIVGLKPGTTMVYARARDNSGKYAVCYVTVIAPIASTGVSVSDTEVVLMPGETKAINISMRPNNSTDQVTWSSSNEAIATVSGSGIITAVSTGTTSVTVMTASGRTARVSVIVLGLSRESLEISVYTQYSRLVVDGATATVRWDVEDTSICEVANGVITARKIGTTYVTATVNGRTLRCRVKVVK